MYKKVLIIDDSEFDRFVAQRIITLGQFSEQVVTVDSARQGIEYLLLTSSNDPDNLPAIIFLDIDMEGMNGFDFLDQFATMPKTITTTCRIVMLTSSIAPEDMKRAYKSKHVVGYIHKPLDRDKLNNLFSKEPAGA
jgi:CheY-like chemotaxis protein